MTDVEVVEKSAMEISELESTVKFAKLSTVELLAAENWHHLLN